MDWEGERSVSHQKEVVDSRIRIERALAAILILISLLPSHLFLWSCTGARLWMVGKL